MGLTLSEQLQQTGGQEPTITKAFFEVERQRCGRGGYVLFYFIYTECSGLQVAWKGVA